MYSMKMLGLVVLGITCIVAFLAGYNHFQDISSTERMREQVYKLDEEIEHVIITGDNRKVEVEVPEDYTIRFQSNQLVTGGVKVPDNGYDMRVTGPNIKGGQHSLLIFIENKVVNVSEIH